MTVKCGDDLVAARRFTDLCHRHMREIFSGGSLPMSDVISRLGDIQSHAKIMHARAIYKSAQTVIDDLTKRCSVQACASSVLTLQRLVRQYEIGLDEIAPKIVAIPAEIVKAPETTSVSPVFNKTRQKQAAEILKPLVKFAQKDDRSSLVKLMSFAANDKALPAKPKVNKIDVIMPSLTNHLLRLARTDDKSVSISYVADECLLDATILKLVQSQLELSGGALIRSCIKSPEERQENGQSQSAHLAITARSSDDRLNILFVCEGVPENLAGELAVLPPLSELGVKAEINGSDGLTRVELNHIPLSVASIETLRSVGAGQ